MITGLLIFSSNPTTKSLPSNERGDSAEHMHTVVRGVEQARVQSAASRAVALSSIWGTSNEAPKAEFTYCFDRGRAQALLQLAAPRAGPSHPSGGPLMRPQSCIYL